MPTFHNWHEIQTVLFALGYRQEISGDQRLIYTNGVDRLILQKLNKIDVAFVLILCRQLGIKYVDFLKIYAKEYERQNRRNQLSKP